MKRIFALVCAAALLAGCAFGGAPGSAVPVSTPASEPLAAPEPTAEPTPQAEETPRDLITGQPSAGGEAMRPVAVMLRNTAEANPQFGLAGADALIEVLSEGKIPSAMALYSHTAELPRVGPVGEARDPLLQLAMPTNPVLMQIGSNAYARNLLSLYGLAPLDGYAIGVTSYDFDRDRDAAGYRNEFCWYTKESLLQDGLTLAGQGAAGGGQPLVAYTADTLPAGGQSAVRLDIAFSPETTTVLEYVDGSYRKQVVRGESWELPTDGDTGAELRFDKVLVLQCAAGIKDDGYTRDYSFTEGTGVYLAQGNYYPQIGRAHV